MQGELLSERKAAKRAGVTRTTLRRHRAAGNITPLVFDGLVLYPLTALEKWKERFVAGELKSKVKRN